ncbi:MoaD/ThiS family protein [Candidatus Bathyarchaeota archaeon]|nr:MoaD/ThiS family protein [Candidatus Bathyarchaeota archaeon]
MRKNRSDIEAPEESMDFIHVEFKGFLRNLAKVSRKKVKVRDYIMLKDLCRLLCEELGEEFERALLDTELQDPRVNSLILVNGQEVSVLKGLETSIKAGDTVTFIPVSHGG